MARLAVPHVADWCVVEMVPKPNGSIHCLAVAHRDPRSMVEVGLARSVVDFPTRLSTTTTGVAAVLPQRSLRRSWLQDDARLTIEQPERNRPGSSSTS